MPGAEPSEGESGRPRLRVGADLPLRVASALALAPLALVAAYLGGWIFLLFWLAAALGVCWEWMTLVFGAESRRLTTVGWAALLVAAACAALGRPEWGALAVAAVAGIAAAIAPSGRGAWAAAGAIYAGVLLLAPVILRADADAAAGFAALLLLFAVVWSTDIGAYFAGRLIGGPKLWPRVSPKKTWSGAVAGTAAAMLAGMLVAKLTGFGALGVALLSLVLSAVSQAGDLFESWVKRRFGAKDASQLIPGHGGLMDRLDGFVIAAAAAALIGLARGGLEAPSRGLLIW
ncbi:MAG TPA: phosphatidate cytidylyltransferase [Xanthobacteraceae bacterium]